MILHHSRWKKIWKKNFGKFFFSEFFWFFGHPLENFWFWTVKTLNFCALIWLLVNWNPKVASRVVFQGGVIMTPPGSTAHILSPEKVGLRPFWLFQCTWHPGMVPYPSNITNWSQRNSQIWSQEAHEENFLALKSSQ